MSRRRALSESLAALIHLPARRPAGLCARSLRALVLLRLERGARGEGHEDRGGGVGLPVRRRPLRSVPAASLPARISSQQAAGLSLGAEVRRHSDQPRELILPPAARPPADAQRHVHDPQQARQLAVAVDPGA